MITTCPHSPKKLLFPQAWVSGFLVSNKSIWLPFDYLHGMHFYLIKYLVLFKDYISQVLESFNASNVLFGGFSATLVASFYTLTNRQEEMLAKFEQSRPSKTPTTS